MNRAFLRPGDVVADRFRVVRQLAEGGMGYVYEAEHVELGRRVALKILQGDYGQNPTVVARFQREARTAAGIGHPNIVQVLDLGRLHDGAPYLVMEFLRGEDLEAPLERGETLTLERVCELLGPVASALDAAHARGIFHRDIKPANIFLADTGGGEVVKLVDFGLAALRDADVKLTKLDMILGTPHYMAPEAAEGNAATAKADVYSLAAVAFELLTGHVPHEADSVVGILTAKVTETAPRLSDVTMRPLPRALDAIFADALSRDPERRPDTAGAFVKRLRSVAQRETTGPVELHAVTGRASTPTPMPARSPLRRSDAETAPDMIAPAPPRRRRPWPLIAALALGALAVGLSLAWTLSNEANASERSGSSPDGTPPRETEPAPAASTPAAPIPAAAPTPAAPTPAAPTPVTPGATPGAASSVARSARRLGAERERAPARAGSSPTAPRGGGASSPPGAALMEPPSPAPPDERVDDLLRDAQRALLRGQLSTAERLFREASYSDSSRAEVWRGLGVTYERLGRAPEAARAYRRFLRVAPAAPEAGAVRSRLEQLDS
ncbi:MAG: serine/threonine protein kinase [Sandaracinaceae bacterium]|nr:MAG: serine/threonine protein kinase [Sandaracinaceae bacterium]